jgi:hypothetical protein
VGGGDEVCMQTTNALVDACLFHDDDDDDDDDVVELDTLRGGASERGVRVRAKMKVKVEERSGISHILPDGGMAVLRSNLSGQLGNSWSGPLLRMGLALPCRMSLVC